MARATILHSMQPDPPPSRPDFSNGAGDGTRHRAACTHPAWVAERLKEACPDAVEQAKQIGARIEVHPDLRLAKQEHEQVTGAVVVEASFDTASDAQRMEGIILKGPEERESLIKLGHELRDKAGTINVLVVVEAGEGGTSASAAGGHSQVASASAGSFEVKDKEGKAADENEVVAQGLSRPRKTPESDNDPDDTSTLSKATITLLRDVSETLSDVVFAPMVAWSWRLLQRRQDDIAVLTEQHTSDLGDAVAPDGPSSRRRDKPTLDAAEPEAPVDAADALQPLPTELLIKIFRMAILEETQDNTELSLFGRLRLVAKPVKELAEVCFQRTLSRYTARVVRDMLHVPRRWSPDEHAKLVLASAPLFQKARHLAVWYTPDAEHQLNTVLPHFVELEQLVIYVISGDTHLKSVNLESCCRLESLHVEVLRHRQGAAEDVYLTKPFHPALPPDASLSSTWANKRLKRFRIGPVNQPQRTLLLSLAHLTSRHLDSFDMSNGFLDRAAVNALLLFLPRGPATLDFRSCQATDGAIDELKLGTKENLRMLNLRNNIVRDPRVLCLDSNESMHSIDLAFNRLKSTDFRLNDNRHLRHLDLTACFQPCSMGERGSLLQELTQQLSSNATLERLVLAENGITDLVASNFTLGSNGGLKELSLADNRLSATGVSIVLVGNTVLAEVDLRGNLGVTEENARELSNNGARRIAL